jgi:hypothetical protein
MSTTWLPGWGQPSALDEPTPVPLVPAPEPEPEPSAAAWAPTPKPWRNDIAGWSIPWRLAYGLRRIQLGLEGVPFPEDERQAANETHRARKRDQDPERIARRLRGELRAAGYTLFLSEEDDDDD